MGGTKSVGWLVLSQILMYYYMGVLVLSSSRMPSFCEDMENENVNGCVERKICISSSYYAHGSTYPPAEDVYLVDDGLVRKTVLRNDFVGPTYRDTSALLLTRCG